MQGQKQQQSKTMPQPKPFKQTIKYKILLDYQYYFEKQLQSKVHESAYNIYSIISHEDQDRVRFTAILNQIFEKWDQYFTSQPNSKVKQCHEVNEPLQKNQKIKNQQLKQNMTQQNQGESKQISTEHQQSKEHIIKQIKQKLGLDKKTQKGVASLLGLAICDALGASTQFIPFVKQRRHLIAYDFEDVTRQINKRVLGTRSGRVGIWTDDCSMALSMADSFLLNNYKFNAKHMRYMFHMWLEHGLNNGGRKYSIGLGGNIAISMRQFKRQRSQYTEQGDKFNNGNGSLMRLAPAPMCFYNNQAEAMEFSQKQSRTTHNGDEAKQCSRLLALILVRLINREQQNNWKQVIQQACSDFVTKIKTIPTVQCLASSKRQQLQLYEAQAQRYGKKFTKYNKDIDDRNWNWKQQSFTYSKTRTEDQPGYVGSYCMDALAMALHTVWFSHSFKQVALWNANMGGDCDTVGAIAGQIAGAIYGIDQYMLHLYHQMQDAKTRRYQVFLKAYKLMTHRPI